jgi:CheY-like chemotaxis protein
MRQTFPIEEVAEPVSRAAYASLRAFGSRQTLPDPRTSIASEARSASVREESGRCVLLIEDDADTRLTLAEILQEEGYSVIPAVNGEDALRALEAGLEPEVILLDLMMPVMDGWEFRRRQLKNPEFAQIPVVVMSGIGESGATAARPGFSNYMMKPVDVARLLSLLETV